jgi:hypothetical protein
VNPKEGGPTDWHQHFLRGGTKTKYEDVAKSEESTTVPVQLLIRLTNSSTPGSSSQSAEGSDYTVPYTVFSVPNKEVVKEAFPEDYMKPH